MNAKLGDHRDVPFVAERPFTWDTVELNHSFQTGERTITAEAVASFCEVTGMEGGLFTDPAYAQAAGYPAPLAPGALIMSTAEGLVLRTKAFHGSGIAFLQGCFAAVSPVFAGDTIHATVTITAARGTKNPERGIVTTLVKIMNQQDTVVMTYEPTRMIRSQASYDSTQH